MSDKINEKEYRKIQWEQKNLSALDFPLRPFTFEEMRYFLYSKGYTIVVKKGMAETVNTESTVDMEVIRTPGGIKEVEDVFAVKEQSNEIVPERFDSEEARNMQIEAVFQRELKNKILYG